MNTKKKNQNEINKKKINNFTQVLKSQVHHNNKFPESIELSITALLPCPLQNLTLRRPLLGQLFPKVCLHVIGELKPVRIFVTAGEPRTESFVPVRRRVLHQLSGAGFAEAPAAREFFLREVRARVFLGLYERRRMSRSPTPTTSTVMRLWRMTAVKGDIGRPFDRGWAKPLTPRRGLVVGR